MAKKGRPTKFKQEYNQLAYNYALLGATDTELAGFFDISEATLNTWKNTHKDFLESLKRGKDEADAIVASKLFHRATGYEHEDVDIKVIGGEIVKTPLVKHYPPDTAAAIFWMKNRQRGKWTDKVEQVHSGSVEFTGIEIKVVKTSDESQA